MYIQARWGQACAAWAQGSITYIHTHTYTCTYRHAGGRLVRPGLKDLFRRPRCGGPEALLHFRLPHHLERLGCGRGDGVRGCCEQRFVHNCRPCGWCDMHLDRLCGQVRRRRLRPQCFSAACSCAGVVVGGLSAGETNLRRWHSVVREGHGRSLAGCASVANPSCEKTITTGADMVIAVPKYAHTRALTRRPRRHCAPCGPGHCLQPCRSGRAIERISC